jgi:cellulose synthase/poly-beta-1,6-N-acetylglucosamine synthase-like glycosyltransferase
MFRWYRARRLTPGNAVTRACGPDAYRVRYRTVHGSRRGLIAPLAFGLVNVAAEAFFVSWLLWPGHVLPWSSGPVIVADVFVVASIAVMEILRLIQVVSLSLASTVSCDPLPPPSPPRLRCAVLTTIVPDTEPIQLVRRTLEAALEIRCDDLDVWLLDEGDESAIKNICARLGVRHHSRRGIARYNCASGSFEAKTKHGNLNSWLDAHGADYDVILCVDPDHVPVREFAELVLGYFNDPDIAYVVGPQIYGNTDSFVSRAAESQQFPFHSVIQRAGNRYRAPMLVGTNNAIRVSALRAVGGFRPSITEDMATGIELHTTRNALTGRRWQSVYVPDVLAIGEGPASWSDYFGQQLRWSRGSYQVAASTFLRRGWRLSPTQFLHYLLIAGFYPSMALGWLLGAVNAALFVGFGASGISVPVQLWTLLYLDTTMFQLWVYVRARKHNVSPVEASGTSGLIGMTMSVVTSSMYALAFLNAAVRRRGRFVVTPKGSLAGVDSWRTFRTQISWALAYVGLLAVAIFVRHSPAMVLMWPLIALVIAVSPIVMWRVEQARLRPTSPNLAQAYGPRRTASSPAEQLAEPALAMDSV